MQVRKFKHPLLYCEEVIRDKKDLLDLVNGIEAPDIDSENRIERLDFFPKIRLEKRSQVVSISTNPQSFHRKPASIYSKPPSLNGGYKHDHSDGKDVLRALLRTYDEIEPLQRGCLDMAIQTCAAIATLGSKTETCLLPQQASI